MNRRKVLISALLLVTWLCVTAQNRTSQSNGTSGYWELVKTNIIQHEDTHNENGNYTLYTAKATEHTKIQENIRGAMLQLQLNIEDDWGEDIYIHF